MAHTVQFNERDGIVEIHHTGALNPEAANAGRAEAGKLMQEHRCLLMLVDLREVAVDYHTADQVDFHESHRGVMPPGLRIAVVFTGSKELLADARFSENVAANRGVALRHFTDPEEARAWLKGKQPNA